MDPITGAALISGGLQLGSALLGQDAANKQRDAQERALRDAQARVDAVALPDTEKMKLALEQLASAGNFSPEMLSYMGLGDTELNNISLDPNLRARQMNALQQMAGIAEKGMSDIDRAALEEMLRSSRAEDTAARKSIIENRAARGMAGGGDELAAALGASQGSANRRSSEALKLAAQAAANRQNALSTSSNMAQAIEASDYNRAMNLASRRDAINEFNNRLANTTAQQNTGLRNDAQMFNLGNQQRIQDSNVGLRNEQQKFNKGLAQLQFENQMNKATQGQANSQALANMFGQRAAGTAAMYTDTAAGIGSIIGAFAKKPAGSSGGAGGSNTPTAN